MPDPSIAICIPTIPQRPAMLSRAVASAAGQTLPAHCIAVAVDLERLGAAHTRNRAARMAGGAADYLAFLDDDDELDSNHLAALYETARDTDADMVYSWYRILYPDGTTPAGDVLPHFGKKWNPDEPTQTTVTCLWKAKTFWDIGGFPSVNPMAPDELGNRVGEDFMAVCNLNNAGGKIVHRPERTWTWHHHGLNTSGAPNTAAMIYAALEADSA